MSDITESKQAAEVLQQEKEKSQLYLNSAGVMMIALDVNGCVTLINKKGREILKCQEADILGKNWFTTFLPEQGRERIYDMFLQVISGDVEPAQYYETPVLTISGQERLIAWHNNLVTDSNGNILGTLGSVEDITDRRKAEQLAGQVERYQAIADFASGVAHNFNNLLQIIIGSADLGTMNLQSGDFSNLNENLDQIKDSSRFGAETVRRLNRYVRSLGDGTVIDSEVFDLSELVGQATEMSRTWCKTEFEKRGIMISLDAHLESGCTIRGNKSDIFDGVVNIIKNAIEAVPGGGYIEIDAAAEGDNVVLRIRDTGIGIPKENLNRLFTPFFTTNVEAGRGLGLAMCRRTVDAHGGTIHVGSIDGKGTTFTITFPFVPENPVPHEVAQIKIDGLVKSPKPAHFR